MKYRIFLIIVFGIISLAAAFGLYKRQTYTDITKLPDYMNSFAVAQLSEKMAIEECEKLEKLLPESPIILKVHAVEPVEHLFKISQQKVQVDAVYKGEDLNMGDYIYITSNYWKLNTTGEPASIERGFVNVMQENREYLIFLAKKNEQLENEEISVYRLVEESVVQPVFSFEEHRNVVAELGEYQYSTYVRYEKVKENEFFATTEMAMNAMVTLKNKMLDFYQ
ncbi:MAG: hypothetical protein IKK03_01320 [Lachnospiraceae bacterium]|nr:hypothetical protein [Lachnospiraceae bacterium]